MIILLKLSSSEQRSLAPGSRSVIIAEFFLERRPRVPPNALFRTLEYTQAHACRQRLPTYRHTQNTLALAVWSASFHTDNFALSLPPTHKYHTCEILQIGSVIIPGVKRLQVAVLSLRLKRFTE